MSPTRKRSAHAVSGLQNRVFTPTTMMTIVTIAASSAGMFSSAVADATKDPMPGSA